MSFVIASFGIESLGIERSVIEMLEVERLAERFGVERFEGFVESFGGFLVEKEVCVVIDWILVGGLPAFLLLETRGT